MSLLHIRSHGALRAHPLVPTPDAPLGATHHIEAPSTLCSPAHDAPRPGATSPNPCAPSPKRGLRPTGQARLSPWRSLNRARYRTTPGPSFELPDPDTRRSRQLGIPPRLQSRRGIIPAPRGHTRDPACTTAKRRTQHGLLPVQGNDRRRGRRGTPCDVRGQDFPPGPWSKVPPSSSVSPFDGQGPLHLHSHREGRHSKAGNNPRTNTDVPHVYPRDPLLFVFLTKRPGRFRGRDLRAPLQATSAPPK